MRFHYLLPGLLLGLLTASRATAQTTPADTTRISYEEEVQPAALPAEAAAPLLVQSEVQQQQWKLGLNNFLLGSIWAYRSYNRVGVHVAYERKLTTALAVQAELSPAVARYRPDNGTPARALGARVQLMGRYYYNLERRIRKGKSRGSFVGNYVALAVGSKLGRHTYETPFYFLPLDANRGAAVDVALLYGLQRRLGRRGFIDANFGLTKLIEPFKSKLGLSSSLRVGLLLGTPAAPPPPATQLTPDDNAQLRPRLYVGTQLGSYGYKLRFSDNNPYATRPNSLPSGFPGQAGVGTYSVEVKYPYYYMGYQLRPQLALQLGYQGQAGTLISSSSYYGNDFVVGSKSETYEQTLAFPLLARYSLTRQYQQRVQFDVVGGAALVYARVRNQETRTRNDEVMEQYAFGRHSTGGHLTGGLNASYGIGRRRKLQLTAEYVLIQSLQSTSNGQRPINSGGSLGLRYRFGPTF
ncbi:hypothetical protein [Hymenobacter actinosclerus]|uniref:Outer membrane protein beta-barrel domain-containing protein n=1 Tax=Hymenobacter actinosclerus TaxID=82805 RepID=A0A1I0F2J3_9BACT|nr:hypothetical protein [Hymenobacter actinosclerus]SET52250.1 hypothetical protein SAMN04487998_2100 [Hymenobacter actinosclerus]